MCLYNDVKFLGIPGPYSVDVGHGPPTVARYKDNVRRPSRNVGDGAYLVFRFSSVWGPGRTFFVELCTMRASRASIGRLWAFSLSVTIEMGANEVKMLDDAHATDVITDISPSIRLFGNV